MRYFLAAILVCALGAPAAFALPGQGSNGVALSKADPVIKVAKRAKAHARRQSSRGLGGIHPLVGSGDY